MKPTHSFGAYGKLPCALEFLRHACYEGSAKEYRAWIDEGHDHLSMQEGTHGEQGHHQVLFTTRATPNEALAAICTASRDATGGRKFPFTVFSRMNSRPQDLAGIAACWRALEAQLSKLRQAENSDQFYERAQSATLNIEPEATSTDDDFEKGSADRWIRSLFATASDNNSENGSANSSNEQIQTRWCRGLWYLRSLAPALAAQKEAPILTAYRLPFAVDFAATPQLLWWLQLLGSLGAPLKGLPTVVVSTEISTPRVHLFWRDPAPEDWSLVTSDTPVGDRLCDLTSSEVRLPSQGYDAFEQRILDQSFTGSLRVADLRALEVLA